MIVDSIGMQRGRVHTKFTGSAAVSTTDPQATQSQAQAGTYAAEQRYERPKVSPWPCTVVEA